jgi:hypothetical protein
MCFGVAEFAKDFFGTVGGLNEGLVIRESQLLRLCLNKNGHISQGALL